MAQAKNLTEQQYLDVLKIIDDKMKDITIEELPKEILSLAARILFNLERIAVAQEIIAGTRQKELLP